MIVVLLAGTVREAEQHARLAGVARSDTIIPRTSRGLEGLRLGDGDLIVEFPSFVDHPCRSEVYDTLLRTLAKSKAKPVWERVGR